MGPLERGDEAGPPQGARATSSTTIEWTTLAEYLRYLEKQRHLAQRRVLHRRRHHPRERHRPREQGADAGADGRDARAGAQGDGRRARSASARRSSTRPALYATTEELIELCKVAAKYQGKYISHMRSEGDRLLEAVDELIRISREAGLPAEIYHLKAAGESNWPKMDTVPSPASRRRASRACRSPRTCTRTPPAPPASTPACRRGRATAATRRCSSASTSRKRARASSPR